MATEDVTAPDTNEAPWQRISPVSVLDMVVVSIRQGAIQALPGLIVLFASAASSDSIETTWIARGVVLLILLGLGWAVLSYLRFGYRVQGARIEVRKGVLLRQTLNVEFERIQNVSVQEPFYLRPFGQAVVGIDTAGSQGKEIRLSGLTLEQAQALRERLVVTVVPASDDEPGAASSQSALATPEGEILIQLSRKDVVLAGLTTNFMLWAAIAIGTILGSGESAENLVPWVAGKLRLDMIVQEVRAEGGNVLVGLVSAGVVLFALLMLPVISMIGALFRYDGYTLTESGDRFRKTSGLLSKHDDSVRQHKIQGVTWKQNAIARLLGRINLILRQASAGVAGDQPPGAGGKQAFMVPSLTPDSAGALSTRFLPGFVPGRATLTRVDRGRYLLMVTLLPLLISIAPFLSLSLALDARIALGWPLVAILIVLIVYRCWRQTGWAVDADHALFRSGFIGSTTTLFPLFKVQRVDLVQTPAQRRRGLAHLTLHMASHSMTMPWMNADDAERIRDLTLYRAETATEAWF